MINSVVLVGRLTKDIELRKSQSGISVVRFTIACQRKFKNKQTGDYESDFINCIAYRQSADFMANYCRKGNLIGVEGNIQTGSYEKDGRTVYTTDVVCDSVRLLEKRESAPQGTEQANTNEFEADLGNLENELPF